MNRDFRCQDWIGPCIIQLGLCRLFNRFLFHCFQLFLLLTGIKWLRRFTVSESTTLLNFLQVLSCNPVASLPHTQNIDCLSESSLKTRSLVDMKSMKKLDVSHSTLFFKLIPHLLPSARGCQKIFLLFPSLSVCFIKVFRLFSYPLHWLPHVVSHSFSAHQPSPSASSFVKWRHEPQHLVPCSVVIA